MSREDEHMELLTRDDSGLELGLTLGVGVERSKQYSPSSFYSSSSSSSFYVTKAAFGDQVVGWPPIRAYRRNNMNQVKYPSSDEFQPMVENCKSKNDDIDMNNCEGGKNFIVKDQGQLKKSKFVKANKDGNGIGRKVDLSTHSCYETLAQAMDDMFSGACATRSSVKQHHKMVEATSLSKLLDGSSEFVLTYEDKDGDWMLVGDVPWGMFVNSVKRLRIMRTADGNELGRDGTSQ